MGEHGRPAIPALQKQDNLDKEASLDYVKPFPKTIHKHTTKPYHTWFCFNHKARRYFQNSDNTKQTLRDF